jgi:hypothetical protein
MGRGHSSKGIPSVVAERARRERAQKKRANRLARRRAARSGHMASLPCENAGAGAPRHIAPLTKRGCGGT